MQEVTARVAAPGAPPRAVPVRLSDAWWRCRGSAGPGSSTPAASFSGQHGDQSVTLPTSWRNVVLRDGRRRPGAASLDGRGLRHGCWSRSSTTSCSAGSATSPGTARACSPTRVAWTRRCRRSITTSPATTRHLLEGRRRQFSRRASRPAPRGSTRRCAATSTALAWKVDYPADLARALRSSPRRRQSCAKPGRCR